MVLGIEQFVGGRSGASDGSIDGSVLKSLRILVHFDLDFGRPYMTDGLLSGKHRMSIICD
jgi:hypothetical protein